MAHAASIALLPELPCSTPHDNAIIEAFKRTLTSMSKAQSKVFAMFADVSGSARLFQRIGDTEAAYAVERCVRRMERSIAGYRGQTVKISGGELVAAFDSAEDACQAAINMQLRVSKLPPVSGLKLTIRIGLHVGAVDAGSAVPSEEVISAARNRAVTGARNTAALARIDQIVASSMLIRELPKRSAILSRPMPDLGRLKEGEKNLDLCEVDWLNHDEPHHKHDVTIDPTPSQMLADVDRLCVRYRGNAFVLDEKTSSLTLGRSPESRLLIIDTRPRAPTAGSNGGWTVTSTSTAAPTEATSPWAPRKRFWSGAAKSNSRAVAASVLVHRRAIPRPITPSSNICRQPPTQ